LYRITTGTPYARILNSFGPGTPTFPRTQTFMIYAEPVGTYEESAQSSADIRIEKLGRLGSANLGLSRDVLNSSRIPLFRSAHDTLTPSLPVFRFTQQWPFAPGAGGRNR